MVRCLVLLVIGCLLSGTHGISYAFAEAGVKIYSQYAPRTAKILVTGELFDGRKELAGQGSGFFVGTSTVVTAAHLIPNEANYKSTDITVRLHNLSDRGWAATLEEIDRETDLAILTLSKSVEGMFCPVLFSARGYPNETSQPGTTIFVLGFPLDKELSISRGILSNTSDPSGEWQSDLTLNPGNSGGPIFNSAGHLLGIAVRRTRAWITSTGEEIDVDGVSYFVPTEKLIANSKFQFPNDDSRGCWSWQLPGGGRDPASALEEPTELINVQLISRTKDDHPVLFGPHSRNYTTKYEAIDGYKITQCDLEAISANHASDVTCNVAGDGSVATLDFRLTSGPQIDRWRGWYHARVSLKQTIRE